MISKNLRRQPSPRITRHQLVGALIIAAIIPYVIRVTLFVDKASAAYNDQTLLIVIVSTTLSYWFTRNILTYPGVEKTSYILTSAGTAYALTLSLLFLFRIEYSRFLLSSGFILTVAWLYLTEIVNARHRNFRVGLAPFGRGVSGLQQIVGTTWVPLHDPVASPDLAVDIVAADLRMDMPDRWERALADYALDGIPVYHIKHLLESLTGQVDLEHISENTFGSLSPVSAYMTLKHCLDWIMALIVLLAILPILLLCGIVIRLDSPGPALFRQRRIGYQGRSFSVYKLRTMTHARPDAGTRDSAMTKSGDARVTRIGRFLRTSRLDELPQLLNVLQGQMSWIGPRPEAEVLGKWYEAEIPFYRYRHIVRPGITGWAQVNQGHVAEVADVKTKLNYDFYYIKNFSPWLDMLIVARTVRTMLTGYGAR